MHPWTAVMIKKCVEITGLIFESEDLNVSLEIHELKKNEDDIPMIEIESQSF